MADIHTGPGKADDDLGFRVEVRGEFEWPVPILGKE